MLAHARRKEPFFQALSPEVVARIGSYGYHREYEPRQIIYLPDDRCEHVYWVRDGRVEVRRVADGRRNPTFCHLFPGDLFGEECLVKDGRRGAYAEAMMTTVVCLMWAQDFRRIVADEREVALALAQHSGRRVIDLENVLAETVFKTVRSLVGSTPETTTTVLHKLREDGILSIANRRVTAPDPVALEHAARSG